MTSRATPKVSPLNIGLRGRIRGAANIEYNVPFPVRNGSFGGGRTRGLVMHTEVSPTEDGVEQFFNESTAGASATFSVGFDGTIHQYGPIGKGWYAWAQVAGNREWYSCEFEDGGDPRRPLTWAQQRSAALLLECLSDYAKFPMQITDDPDGFGFGVHNMGGQAWGGHSCPDLPPDHTRSRQRAAIITLAQHIRTQRKSSRK